jgi:hypothetical protein
MSSSLGGMRGPTGFSNSLKGTGYKNVSLQQFTPEQMSLFQSLFSNLKPGSSLSNLASGDQSQFGQLERPALQQFAGMQSNLADRFSGAGLGNRRSSAFQNAQTSAAQNFAGQLQSQRMGLQQQAMRDLMEMSQGLLNQRPYENRLIEKEPPFWQQMLSGLAGFGGQIGGSYLGKKWGV